VISLLVEVKTELYEKVRKIVQDKNIKYTRIQHFVNVAVAKLIQDETGDPIAD